MDHETVVRLLLMIPALCSVAFLMWVLYNLACECGPRRRRRQWVLRTTIRDSRYGLPRSLPPHRTPVDSNSGRRIA